MWQKTASKYKSVSFNKITILAGGIVTKDAIVHAAQQDLFTTHHTVITMD